METVRIEIPIETIDKTEPGVSNATKKFDKMSKAEKDAGNAADRASKQVSKFDKTAGKTAQTLNRLTRGKYRIMLEAKDRIAPILSKIGTKLRSFTHKTWRVTVKATDYATRPIRGILRMLKNPLLLGGGVLGIGMGIKSSISTFADFQKQMSKVEAIGGNKLVGRMEEITAKAKEMGETTKFTATEAGQAFEYMAMAGWNADQMMQGISGVMSLSAASGESLGKTSDIVTDVMTAMNMSADQADHFADVLAVASSSSNTNVGLMGETFKYAANMAGTLGYSIEDTAVAIGMMANTGLKGSMAGTALQQMMKRLAVNTNGARDTLESLGISFYDAEGKARPLGKVLDELRNKTKGMSQKELASITDVLGGTRGGNGLQAYLKSGKEATKSYKELRKEIYNASGASKEMSDKMLDNMSGALTYLKSKWEGVKISFGSRFEKYVTGIAHVIKDHLPDLEKGLNSMMDKVDAKVNDIKSKMQKLVGTQEWKKAGFLGKIKLSFDEIVAKPFAKWWNGGGKKKISDKLGEIGHGIGSAVNAGFLTLLGISTDVVDEGASAGAKFAKGFVDGLDFKAISSKLWDAIKHMFDNAAKLLPGGEEADFSSLLSAGLLFKVFSPLVKGGKGLFGLGKSALGLFGIGKGAAAAAGGAATAGSGIAGTAVAGGAGAAAGGGTLATLGTAATGTVGLPALAVGLPLIAGTYLWGEAVGAKAEDRLAKIKAGHARGKSDNVYTYINAQKATDAATHQYQEGFGSARQYRVGKDYQQSLIDLKEAEKKYAEANEKFRFNKNVLWKELTLGNIDEDEYNEKLNRELAILSEGATAIMNARSAHELLRKEKERESEVEKKLKELRDQGRISEEKYNKALDEGLRGNKSASQVVADTLTGLKGYQKAAGDLTKRLDDMNVPTEQQKALLNKVRDAYIEGRITIADYKEMVKECGGDVQELTKKINDIPEEKKIKIHLTTPSNKDILDGKASIPGLPSNIPVEVALGLKYLPKNAGETPKESVDNAIPDMMSTDVMTNLNLRYNVMNVAGAKDAIKQALPAGMPTDVQIKVLGQQKNAAGGYVSGGPQLSWLAEEGYGEYVIPTNPSRRSRALMLWKQAGDALHVAKNAAGGFISGFKGLGNNSSTGDAGSSNSGYGESSEGAMAYSPSVAIAGAGANVNVNVTLNPSFNVSGNGGSIIDSIRAEMGTIADEVAGNIADRIGDVFANMPSESED